MPGELQPRDEPLEDPEPGAQAEQDGDAEGMLRAVEARAPGDHQDRSSEHAEVDDREVGQHEGGGVRMFLVDDTKEKTDCCCTTGSYGSISISSFAVILWIVFICSRIT